MYFVHPQLKFNLKNIINLKLSFLKKKREIKEIKKLFPDKSIYYTDMGRSAFRLIIEKLELQNSQIIMPAYICNIFAPILKRYKIEPLFLDIDKNSFNLKPKNIREKITEKTKAVLVVHTYGKAAQIEEIRRITKEKEIYLIEDCAHSFGFKYKKKYLGSFGDASFFSFYKLFPTLRGGMALISSHLDKKEIELKKTSFSLRDIFSLLNCFSFFSYFFKKFAGRTAEKNVRDEKLKEIGKMNRVSLNILNWQLKNWTEKLKRRKDWALDFIKEAEKLGFQFPNKNDNSFTFLSGLAPDNLNRDNFVVKMRKFGVFPTRIWHFPIILNKEFEDKKNDFPNTLRIAEKIINFPLQNFYKEKDKKKIIKRIKKFRYS